MTVLRLKVTLVGTKPPIWRRFEVSADLSLRHLHDILQVVMGWTDSHLHQFEQDGTLYGESDREFGLMRISERTTRIGDVLSAPKDHVTYEYDFGDSWTHKVIVEQVTTAAERTPPRVLAAKGACPPEDIGGLGGFYEFLDVMASPRHPDYKDRSEWLGGQFLPEAYDLDEVNARLEKMHLKPPAVSKRARKTGARLDPMSRLLQAVPPEPDARLLEALRIKLLDPTAILNDREVRYMAAEVSAVVGRVDIPGLPPTFAEDMTRWKSIESMCAHARAERGLSTKDAAKLLKLPNYRIVAVESGAAEAFDLECAVRYFRLLGIERWVSKWARANPDLAKRVGLA